MDIAKLLFELGYLKKLQRTGWAVVGVPDGDTVASHSFRAALLGYIIAEMEGCDKDRVMKMVLFHDIPEARTGDMHKVTQFYIDPTEAEKRVVADQSERMPKNMSAEFRQLSEEFSQLKTKEAVVAKDADYLETAITAHEHSVNGYKTAGTFIERTRKVLRTRSAKKLLAEIEKGSGMWWEGFKKNR